MRLIAKVIRISRAKFYCNRLTSVQYIQGYASIIFWEILYISSPPLVSCVFCPVKPPENVLLLVCVRF